MARKRSSGQPGLVLLLVIGGVLVSGAQALLKILHIYGPLLIGIAILVVLAWALAKLFGTAGRESGGSSQQPFPPKAGQPKSSKDVAVKPPDASKARPDASTRRLPDRQEPPVSALPANNDAVIDAGRQTGLFSIPAPVRWVAPGQSVAVHGYMIEDGMVYVGSDKGQPDASTIDPSRNVRFDKNLDFTAAQLGYWPSYSQISAEGRGAYLQWLADGKKHRDANIGFVFLYFYGLERRALADAASDPAAALELSAIAAEIIRLLEIYSGSGSFRGYANSLLGFVRAVQSAGQEPPESPPAFAKSWEIPFALKLGLAHYIAQEAPIPGDWAYAWWLAHPETRLKKAAERCPGEFKQLFIEYYQQQHQPGLRLRPNKTKLVAIHRAASPSLPRRQYEHTLDLPDVTVLAAPMKKLQAAADYCYQALDGYSRHLGRKPDNAGKIDALLELPTLLWPEAMKQPLLKIHRMVSLSGLSLAVKFDKLLSLLPPWETVNKSSYAAFARAVGQIGLGIEPDPLFGGAVPGNQQTVVLFVGEPQDLMAEPGQRYKTAALSLHFAATVSLADGEFSVQEREAMVRQMEEWLHLGDGERARLRAYLRWLAAEPPGLNGLKKRIEDMPVSAREALGDFLVLVAKADQQVSPAEVKLLERIYKMLGLDAQGLYGKLHAPASEPVTVRLGAETTGYAIPRPAVADGLGLDMARVSALQEDSRRVADILHGIFGEEDTAPDAEPGIEAGSSLEATAAPGLMGLHQEYSEFVRVLVSRSQWTRAELEELAADRSLLLDGVLEHINEAAFDRFDQPLAEGDDPVEINQELAGELIA